MVQEAVNPVTAVGLSREGAAIMRIVFSVVLTLSACMTLVADNAPASWEAQALGVTDGDKLSEVRALPVVRRVRVAVVGQGGVSLELVKGNLSEDFTLTYKEGASDVGANTHDTQAVNVMIPLARKLNVPIDFYIYHAGNDFSDVARHFKKAGETADIIILYQSFWGPVDEMVESIRASTGALFISPYVESGGLPTSTCLQAHSAGDGQDRLSNFITCAPLARAAPGEVLTPARRNNEDTEVINFICPSYYASGAGGTCPSATVCCVAAAYAVSRLQEKPSPAKLVELLKNSTVAHPTYLLKLPEFSDESLQKLTGQLDTLHKEKKLYSPGIVNMYKMYAALKAM